MRTMSNTSSTPLAGSNGTSSTATLEPAVSLRDRIKSTATVFPTETVQVPEWNVTVEVRSMTIADQSRLVDRFTREDGTRDVGRMVPAIVVATCFDPVTGERVFTDDDLEWLADQPAKVVDDVASVGLRVSGLTAALVPDRDIVEGKSVGS